MKSDNLNHEEKVLVLGAGQLGAAVLDALVAGGGIRDDARVVRLHADKTYSDDDVAPGVAVLAGAL